MGFEILGSYVWDFWFAWDDETIHMFFLTAPKTSEHADLRHPHARIGHATSHDLMTWKYEGIVLGPSEEPCWDDGTTWTGSVVKRPDGKWMMFYTGTQLSESRKYQRIGAAVSDDLFTWTRLGRAPLLEVDPEIYETYDPSRWHDQAFRDPWVYPDPGGHGWRMIFTARVKDGLPGGSGVIGQASSPDLLTWKAEKPLFSIGHYGEMEVPQIFELDGWWFCLFSNATRHMEPAYLATGKTGVVTGTHYIRSKEPSGPFELVEDRFFGGDTTGSFYGGRFLRTRTGTPVFLAFLNHRADGSFVGAISDPMPIWTTSEGYLRIDGRQYGMALQSETLIA